jgi:homoserine dehydrogenase
MAGRQTQPEAFMAGSQAQQVRLVLMGAGNVGRRFLGILIRKGDDLRERLGLDLIVVGVSDSSGVALSSDGLDLMQLVDLKASGQGVAAYPESGRPGMTSLEMVQSVQADLFLDASPGNMVDGQPALACLEAAIDRSMHIVTANKAPLVLDFARLVDLAQSKGVRLRYDATVAGGLPAINLGQRDLAAAGIQKLEGILNLTTNYILTRMAQDGLTYDQALADAQEAGHAETDPTLDVEGWDAANKLVILAYSVLRHPITLQDVEVEGILGVGAEQLEQAAADGKIVKLVATAEKDGDAYRFWVRPTRLEASHPMAQLGPKQMGIVYHTDISGIIAAAIVEEAPVPTASGMLRDIVDIYTTGA